MKFPERALILMFLIGYWLAVVRKPADLSLAIISSVGLAGYYLLGMPLILGRVPLRRIFQGGLLRVDHIIIGILAGGVYGYCVLSLLFHNLDWMDSRSLAENCGLLLLLIALPAGILFRTQKDRYYRRLLIRLAVMAGILLLSLAVHPLLRHDPALERMNPL